VLLKFLDREAERARIERALASGEGALICLYGRRRVGKSRLVREVLKDFQAVYYVGDERDAALQRASVSRAMASLIPGFDKVVYPDWEALFERWWAEAPAGAALALDEFPALVSSSPELPSLLQKLLDRATTGRPILITGSSQHMMQGLLLDAAAPLYGRARELVRLRPLSIQWLGKALGVRGAAAAVDHWAVWGGVPRYWELAADHDDLWSAVDEILLDPLGVLHDEPRRLLLDDLQEIARASSILALVGQGCHRVSEIGARLQVQSTSLSRPIQRLLELDLLSRLQPYGTPRRSPRKTLYEVSEPLLRFWYRFVDPNRSRLASGQRRVVLQEIQRAWPQYLGQVWEELARSSVPRIRIAGQAWGPAARWWGAGVDRQPMELDIVADGVDAPRTVLVGEVKTSCTPAEARALLSGLEQKAARCPALRDKIVVPTVWVLALRGRTRNPHIIQARDVVNA